MVTIIATILLAAIPAGSPVCAANGDGEIEFQRGKWLLMGPGTTDFPTVQYRGKHYRITKEPELEVNREELNEVIVQEVEPDQYALTIVVDRSLRNALEALTTASVGGYLATFADGDFLFVVAVRGPIHDGNVSVDFYGRSKSELFDIARRFSDTPRFVPFEGR